MIQNIRQWKRNPWKTKGNYKSKRKDRSLKEAVGYEFMDDDESHYTHVSAFDQKQLICYNISKGTVKELHRVTL